MFDESARTRKSPGDRALKVMFAAACLSLLSCDPMAFAGVVIAPRPAIRADSAARAAFRDSALSLVARVATRDGLHPYSPLGDSDRAHWPLHLALETFFVYGGEEDSLVRVTFREWGSFTDRSNRIRKEVVDSLRQVFGPSLRECTSSVLRFNCPSKAQVDSGR